MSMLRTAAIVVGLVAAGIATGAATRRVVVSRGPSSTSEDGPTPWAAETRTGGGSSATTTQGPDLARPPLRSAALVTLAGVYPASVVAHASTDELFASVGAIRRLERTALERIVGVDDAGSLAACLDDNLPDAVSVELHVVAEPRRVRIADIRVTDPSIPSAAASCVSALASQLEESSTDGAFVRGDGWVSHRVPVGLPTAP